MALKIIFMGTPDFSVPTLSGLIEVGHHISAVYCQPPRPAGRGRKDRKSPVHIFAEEAGIPVLVPKTLGNEKRQAEFAAFNTDLAVVVAYGLILRKPILDAPRLGCLNLHTSLLPRWRGAAPLQRAIMAGDTETGVSVMRMDEGLDTGPVCLQNRVPITPDTTTGELHDVLSSRGAALMTRAVNLIERGELECEAQSEEGATYAAKIKKSEAHIDWTRPGPEVHNLIRGLSPFPGAWFEVELDGRTERIKILKSHLTEQSGEPGRILDDRLTIACETGAIEPRLLQRAGKKPMRRDEFLRGLKLPKDARLR